MREEMRGGRPQLRQMFDRGVATPESLHGLVAAANRLLNFAVGPLNERRRVVTLLDIVRVRFVPRGHH